MAEIGEPVRRITSDSPGESYRGSRRAAKGFGTNRNSEEDSGIRAGEIISFRLWWLVEGKLRSLVRAFFWEPHAVVRGDVDAFIPYIDIYLGVYSFKEQSKALSQMKSWYRWGNGVGSSVILGSILSWGTVIEHEFGYRSECAKIMTLDAIIGPGNLEDLQARYGVKAAS